MADSNVSEDGLNLNTNSNNWLRRIKINIPTDEEVVLKTNFSEEGRQMLEDLVGFLFLPDNLSIRNAPYFIYSQHYGECATDSFLNILFFADGYREYFARLAEKLYKELKNEHRQDLLEFTPYFVSQVERIYQILNTDFSKKEFDDLLTIFARIVRRYIFVMLLAQVGMTTADQLSDIIETICPPRVKEYSVRRKSINVMAGIDIHDAILEFLGKTKRAKKINTNELETKGLLPMDIHTVLERFMKILFAPHSKALSYRWLPFSETNDIQPDLPFLKAVYLTVSQYKEGEIGHAVALFCHSNEWYVADNNLGITLPLLDFKPEMYFGRDIHARFFVCDYQEVDIYQLLNGNHNVKVDRFDFTKSTQSVYDLERLQKSTFYGFVIDDEWDGDQQFVLAIANQNIYPCYPMIEISRSSYTDERIYFFAKDPIQLETTETNGFQENEINPNLPPPFKRTSLKKTKRRLRSKGKKRRTIRSKPLPANQTALLKNLL